MKHALKQVIRSLGYDITRVLPDRQAFLDSRRIDTVIDVGANVGQFAQQLRAEGFKGRIHSFEPVKGPFEALVERAKPDPNWDIWNLGLSKVSGHATINVSKATVFSSLQTIRGPALRFDPEAAIVASETIELRRLDEMNREIGGDRLFLKIDTQGHERQVLEGAGKVLNRIQGIQLELPISMLYENTWTMADAIGFMQKLGFLPTYFYPVNFHQKHDPIAMVEADCIFRRFDPKID